MRKPLLTFQVEILKDCDTPGCITDLRITVNDKLLYTLYLVHTYNTHMHTHTFYSSMRAPIVAGLTTSVEINLVIANLMDPAFNAILSFTVPSRLLTLTNAFNRTRNGEVCYHVYVIYVATQYTVHCMLSIKGGGLNCVSLYGLIGMH